MLLPIKRTCGLLAVVALLAVGTPSAHSRVAATDRPGDVLVSEPTVTRVLPLAAYPAEAWAIRYRSTSARGEPTTVTGTVLVPTARWRGEGPRPVVGFAVGTHGLADRCAPSRQLRRGTEYEAAAIRGLLAEGWAVAITDYQGLGTPGVHPYVVGRSLGRAVLDSVRAAQRLPGAGLSRSGPVALYGYSEGGAAAGWALQLAPSYAPELDLRAGFVGAAPADLGGMLRHHDRQATSFLILYAAIGFDAAYPGLDLAGHLNARGRRAAASLRKSCIWDAPVKAAPWPKDYRAFVTSDPLQEADWRRRLRQNQLGRRGFDTPVLLGAARLDQIVPYRLMTDLRRRWCRRGVAARLHTIAASEHFSGGVAFVPVAVDFLRERFRDDPLPPAEC